MPERARNAIKLNGGLPCSLTPLPELQLNINYAGLYIRMTNPRIGRWHILQGTKTDPLATVLELELKNSPSIYLQKGDDNVLFFLDQQKNLMVGDADFGYTLYRITP